MRSHDKHAPAPEARHEVLVGASSQTFSTALADGHAGAHGASTPAARGDTDDVVLDVKGAAQLLQVGRNTVYELVGRNAIPHRRLGKQIRFSRTAIVQWLRSAGVRNEREGRR